ncbi:MAG: hypothetical protein J6K15_06360 [Lachnospiraceae bacterium]|nr:hypothetical protein [Lachnospiraceae bacterium]
MTPEETALKIAEVEHRSESNTRRIEKLELQTEALEKLATSVELLVAEQRHQTEAMLEIKSDVSKLDAKVETLESKPAKRWESVIEKIILALVGAVVGYFLVKLGLPG